MQLDANYKIKMNRLYKKYETKVNSILVECNEHAQDKNADFEKLLGMRDESEQNNEKLVQVTVTKEIAPTRARVD